MKFITDRIDARLVVATQALSALGLFALDVLTPPGVADGFGYPIVLVLCLWIPGRKYLIGWLFAAVALTVLGALFPVAIGIA